GPDAQATLQARGQTGWALAALGRCAEARPELAAAVAGLEKFRRDQRDMLWALVAKGRCGVAGGRAAAGGAGLEKAVAVGATNALPVYRGIARASLAPALWASGRREAALAAARQAETELDGSAEGARHQAALRAWVTRAR